MAGALARRTEGVKSGSGREYNGLLAARQGGKRRTKAGERDKDTVTNGLSKSSNGHKHDT